MHGPNRNAAELHDGSDINVGIGDILDIHRGVAGKNPVRIRVTSRELDAAANIVVAGPQFNADGYEGRERRVMLVSADQYDVVATPRTEADGRLDAKTIKWLGRVSRSKWYTAADWYLHGWLRSPGLHLVCVLTPSPGGHPDAIRAAVGGAHRNDRAARAHAVKTVAAEVWILTSAGATRIYPQPPEGTRP